MWITLGIIVVTVLVSMSAMQNPALFEKLLFQPFVIQLRKEWYRFFTHALIHGGTLHLLVNMYVLYLFGGAVEQAYAELDGAIPGLAYLTLYVGGVVLSSLPGYFKHRDDPAYRAVGASGATSAVVFSFILLNPDTKLMLIFLPIPMAAWIFGALYLGYEWYMSRKGSGRIAHDAHYFGALYGIGFTAILVPNAVSHFIRVIGF